jgi:hypothetical protein
MLGARAGPDLLFEELVRVVSPVNPRCPREFGSQARLLLLPSKWLPGCAARAAGLPARGVGPNPLASACRPTSDAFLARPGEMEAPFGSVPSTAGDEVDAPAIGGVVSSALVTTPAPWTLLRMNVGRAVKELVEHLSGSRAADSVSPKVSSASALATPSRGCSGDGHAERDGEEPEYQQQSHLDEDKGPERLIAS